MTDQALPAPIPSGATDPAPAAPQEEPEKPKRQFTPTTFLPVPDAPEAFGIAWTEMFGEKVNPNTGEIKTFKINVTGRGRTSREALENLVDLITDGKMNLAEFREECKLSLFPHVPAGMNVPARPAAPKQPAASAPASTTPPAAAPKAPAGGVVNQAQDLGGEVTGGQFHIVAMDVAPRADGRVDLKFFGNDRKMPRNQYADITWTAAPDFACEKLAEIGAFTPEHLSKACTYALNCKLNWVYGTNKNRNGQPYKNVVSFQAA